MPHCQAFREVFDPHDLEIAIQAFDRASKFLTDAGDAEGDPNFPSNLAQQIIAVGLETPNLTFLEMTNKAISRYRFQRAAMMAEAARARRGAQKASQPAQ